MKKAAMGTALVLAGILLTSFTAAANAQALRPEDVSEYNLAACTVDGQTARALFGVEGSPEGYSETGKVLKNMFTAVVGRYTADEFNSNAPYLTREMNERIEAAKQELGNMDMIIAGAAEGTMPGCALQ